VVENGIFDPTRYPRIERFGDANFDRLVRTGVIGVLRTFHPEFVLHYVCGEVIVLSEEPGEDNSFDQARNFLIGPPAGPGQLRESTLA
jgi:hypothetical protein